MADTGAEPRLMERGAQENTVFSPQRKCRSQKEEAWEISVGGGYGHLMGRKRLGWDFKNGSCLRGLAGGTAAGWDL